jgi:hypothetical protein
MSLLERMERQALLLERVEHGCWPARVPHSHAIEDVAQDLRLPVAVRDALKRSRQLRLDGLRVQAAYGPFWQMVDGAVMLADQTAITGTTEAAMFPVGQYSGWAANQLRAGQLWYLRAFGVASTPASGQGNITITPRYGTSTSGVSLGASAATALAASATNAPWVFEYLFVVRSVGNAGANSQAVGNGTFTAATALIAAGTGNTIVMGSTASVSVDTSIASGLFIGVTLGSASDSLKTMAAPLSSLN